MCGPPAIALAAAGVSALSTGIGALSANAAARQEARVHDRNAQLTRNEIELTKEANRREALNHYRRVSQLKGRQRAHAAGGNVSADFGTAADMVEETDVLSNEDVSNLYRQGNLDVEALDRRVSNYGAQANAARSRGKGALVQGGLQIAGTVLGGVSRFNQMGLDYGSMNDNSSGVLKKPKAFG